jgi:Tol biopolymer transport system component
MQHTSVNAMPADGGSSRPLVMLDGYAAWGLALSPDGRTLLFNSNRSADPDVWSVPLAGGEMTPFAASPNFDVDADWSPDGRSVSFSSGRGGTGDIWVMPVAGGDARQLTDWPSDEGGARWSPDGATIAFTSTRDATQPEVWTIPVAGGQATRITRGNVSAQEVRWATDGRTLSYVGATADGSRQLFRVSAAGGTPRQLTHAEGGASIFGHAESPDGAQVAYSYNVAGLAYLEVMPAAGGPSRRFHPDTTRAWQQDAAWSPDGSRLAFSNWDYATNHTNLTTVSLPQGEMHRLTTTTDVFEYGMRWTPDGRTLVYASARGTTHVVTAELSRLLAAARP